jgi:hypothetical protein
MQARTGCLLVVVGIAAAPIEARAETCSLYQKWRKDFAAAGPCANQGPYFEVAPAVVAQGPTFFARKVPKCLNGTDLNCVAPEVRSLDGTRAFYYVDPQDTLGTPNQWVIAFEGGGSCGAMRGDTASVACMSGTQDPADNYGFNGYNVFTAGDLDYKEMTSRHAETGRYTIPDRRSGSGILDPVGPNLFNGYNRVIVNKTSFDRFMGNKTTTTVYDANDSVELHFHGRRIISAMLADLDRLNGAIQVGNNCRDLQDRDCQTLDDFSSANRVVVVGNSGGSGGLIHNMEWLKNQILSRAPNAKVFFLLGSRMMPWLEAEANWWSAGNGIWDDIYAGTSTIDGNAGTPTSIIQYGPSAYQAGGLVRTMLQSWGDSTSLVYPFLDNSCKLHHGNGDWRCFDEGHVALYHTDEDVFWYESILDGVHNTKSPAPWIDSADGVNLFDQGGFHFDPVGAAAYTRARGERILYAGESMLQQHPGAGSLAFYMPFRNCHTAVFADSFWTDTMTKNGTIATMNHSFYNWISAIATGSPQDRAWVDDSQSTSPWFWSDGIYGGGWASPGGCTN